MQRTPSIRLDGADRLPRVMCAAAAAVATHPLERKLLVCRRAGVGRELLRSLAVHGVPWANVEVATPRQLAQQLIATELAAEGIVVADEFEELALLDAAMDTVLTVGDSRLAELAEAAGLRRAVAASVRALRLAGIGPTALERARFRDEDKRQQIARILEAYEHCLRDAGRVDTAGLLARAAAALAVGSAQPDARTFVMPGQNLRGLNGALLQALIERGAMVLDADPVRGMARPAAWLEAATASPPTTALSSLHDVAGWSGATRASDDVELAVFAATSLTAELREVLRRVVAEGLRWDEVEIIATDTAAYGVALDGLARRLGIPVTHATGLPSSRTRPGRAAAAYLDWVEQGLPAELLRRMLERGDIAWRAADDAAAVSGTALARRLRALQVGRGRERYHETIRRRLHALEQPVRARDDAALHEERRQRERVELNALAALLEALLATVPAAGDPFTGTSPADIAGALLAALAFVPAADAVDRTVRARLVERLQRISRSMTRQTGLGAAVAIVAASTDDRVPAPEAEGAAPWVSAGGRLHFSDLEHGGYAARRATFVVGLDAARFPGGGGIDALLVDDDRRRLTGGQSIAALPTAADRIDELRYGFASLAARLRGRVTFSYAMWDAAEGRAAAPAAELLQAYRLLTGDAAADYEALHASTAPAASAIPRGSALLDADDVWFDALHSAGTLRRGVTTVCAAYPNLAAGVRAVVARRGETPSAYHGIITPRPQLDPRTGRQPVSATQLETLGTCAHRYLLRHVLRVRPPDTRDATLEQWLSPVERGSLMHTVYDRSMQRAIDDGVAYDDAAFEVLVLDTLDAVTAEWRAQVPPQGEALYELERSLLREDARAFVAMVREDAPRVIALERRFGDDGEPAVEVELPDGGTILLRGAIDRIDEIEDAALAIVDYKTGSAASFGAQRGPFNGGRRLQHVLYAAAAARLFDRSVARAEYHFPTRRSENQRHRYDTASLGDGLAVIVDLLELVRTGSFLPTNDPNDCRFCDYGDVCRRSVDAYGRVDSPLAEWSRESTFDAAALLQRIRR
jgi:ATP-dependent helicase/nuclease subunit B